MLAVGLYILAKFAGASSCNGVCVDTSIDSCDGILVSGLCPGSSNIVCCEEAVSCDSNKGLCLDSNLQNCDGVWKSGYCPGASNILCCEPAAPLPTYCTNPQLANSSYLFTLKNQGLYLPFP